MKREITLIIALLTTLAWAATGAQANPRTFVSVNGTDNNVCGPTTPCRTFNAAALNTDQNGILTALDSGTYGHITINNAMTVQAAPGVYAALGDGRTGQVTINAKAGDVVVLRNLQLNRVGLPTGIEFYSGGALHIEDCVIAGFETGLLFDPYNSVCNPNVWIEVSGGSCPKLFIKDSIIRRNSTGLEISSVFASIDNCRIENNERGLEVRGIANATVSRSVVAGNTSRGITLGYVAATSVENCTVLNNGTGLEAFSDSVMPGRMYVSNTLIAGNKIGIRAEVNNTGELAGRIYTYGNNRFTSNVTDGQFTTSAQQQ
jgi:hypothetical protein